jgi:uncharacterized protein (DUF2336 family)
MLDRIDALIEQGANLSKDSLLDILAELFATRGSHMKKPTQESCVQLVELLMSMASPHACRQTSERFAPLDWAPSRLILSLARRSFDVAEPLLRLSPVLNTSDLLRLIAEASAEHVQAIAARPTLSEAVTNAILLRGDEVANLTLILNRGAQFSKNSFAVILDMAAHDARFLQALIHRADIPAAFIEDLWPNLSTDQGAQLLASGWRLSANDMAHLHRQIQGALIASVRDGGTLPTGIDHYKAMIARGEATPVQIMKGLIDKGALVEVAQLMASVTHVAEGAALNLIYGSYDRGVVLLACACGLESETTIRLICARGQIVPSHVPDIPVAMGMIKKFDPLEAASLFEHLNFLWQEQADWSDNL